MSAPTCSSSGSSLPAELRGLRYARCSSCGREDLKVLANGSLPRHAVPTAAVWLTVEEFEAAILSLDEHLAGDPDDLFGIPGISLEMHEAREKLDHARRSIP